MPSTFTLTSFVLFSLGSGYAATETSNRRKISTLQPPIEAEAATIMKPGLLRGSAATEGLNRKLSSSDTITRTSDDDPQCYEWCSGYTTANNYLCLSLEGSELEECKIFAQKLEDNCNGVPTKKEDCNQYDNSSWERKEECYSLCDEYVSTDDGNCLSSDSYDDNCLDLKGQLENKCGDVPATQYDCYHLAELDQCWLWCTNYASQNDLDCLSPDADVWCNEWAQNLNKNCNGLPTTEDDCDQYGDNNRRLGPSVDTSSSWESKQECYCSCDEYATADNGICLSEQGSENKNCLDLEDEVRNKCGDVPTTSQVECYHLAEFDQCYEWCSAYATPYNSIDCLEGANSVTCNEWAQNLNEHCNGIPTAQSDCDMEYTRYYQCN